MTWSVSRATEDEMTDDFGAVLRKAWGRFSGPHDVRRTGSGEDDGARHVSSS